MNDKFILIHLLKNHKDHQKLNHHDGFEQQREQKEEDDHVRQQPHGDHTHHRKSS